MKQRIVLVYLLLSLVFMSVIPVVSAQDNACSQGTGQQINTAFVNDLGYDITSHWIDFECQEGEGSFIAAGETFTATTYDGHEFIYRNTAGDLIGWYLGSTDDNGQDILISTRLGQVPEWTDEEAIIGDEPEIIEEPESTVETIITLVPIDDSILPTADCSADDGQEVNSVNFWNDTGTDNEIYLYWLNWDCVTEEELYVYPDDHYYEFYTTYVGHEFVFRNADGELLAYHKIVAEDQDAWYPLSEMITVEVTTIGGGTAPQSEEDYQSFISDAVNPLRAEVNKPNININSTLRDYAVNIAENTDPTAQPLLETFGAVSVYDVTTPEFARELAQELGLEGQLSAVLAHNPDGLTHEQIIDILEITIAYEGWTNGELESFALYHSGDVFVLVTSDVVEEEWATFEYEEPSTQSENITETVVNAFDRAGDMTYTFEAKEGEFYALLYQSDEYDTYLYLDDPNGAEYLYNDDGAGNRNSLIVFTAPISGTYTARLDSFQAGASGEYSFGIAQPDSVVNGHIIPDGPLTIPMDVEEGKYYVVWATSTEVDTQLTITTEAGEGVASNDDFNGETNSFVFFMAHETGVFNYTVNSFNNAGTGSVKLYTGSFE
jgi:hypothetical protein